MDKALHRLPTFVVAFAVAWSASASQAGAQVPSPWTAQDIGATGGSSGFDTASEQWTVVARGTDIWGTADQFRYVYLPLSGDGEIIARVAAVQQTDVWAKCGVMIRETLAGGSPHAFMCVTPGNGSAFQRRLVPNGASTNNNTAGLAPPRWMRLTRAGTIFTGYASPDGATWTRIGQDSIAMGASVMMGIALTSHNANAFCTSIAGNVRAMQGGRVLWPPPPTGLTAVPSVRQIDLSWTAPVIGSSYYVRRGPTGTGPWTIIASNHPTTSYRDSGLNEGQPYFYVVSAASTAGESDLTPAASAIPLNPPPRFNDHEEGFLGDRCSCGATAPTLPPLAGAIGLLGLCLLLRRRSG